MDEISDLDDGGPVWYLAGGEHAPGIEQRLRKDVEVATDITNDDQP